MGIDHRREAAVIALLHAEKSVDTIANALVVPTAGVLDNKARDAAELAADALEALERLRGAMIRAWGVGFVEKTAAKWEGK